MKPKIRQNAFVVFDKKSCKRAEYDEYFKDKFEDSLFVFLGEIPNAPGHCILADLKTGKVEGIYHTENFREATEDEV